MGETEVPCGGPRRTMEEYWSNACFPLSKEGSNPKVYNGKAKSLAQIEPCLVKNGQPDGYENLVKVQITSDSTRACLVKLHTQTSTERRSITDKDITRLETNTDHFSYSVPESPDSPQDIGICKIETPHGPEVFFHTGHRSLTHFNDEFIDARMMHTRPQTQMTAPLALRGRPADQVDEIVSVFGADVYVSDTDYTRGFLRDIYIDVTNWTNFRSKLDELSPRTKEVLTEVIVEAIVKGISSQEEQASTLAKWVSGALFAAAFQVVHILQNGLTVFQGKLAETKWGRTGLRDRFFPSVFQAETRMALADALISIIASDPVAAKQFQSVIKERAITNRPEIVEILKAIQSHAGSQGETKKVKVKKGGRGSGGTPGAAPVGGGSPGSSTPPPATGGATAKSAAVEPRTVFEAAMSPEEAALVSTLESVTNASGERARVGAEAGRPPAADAIVAGARESVGGGRSGERPDAKGRLEPEARVDLRFAPAPVVRAKIGVKF